MSDELNEKIRENAAGPKRARGDSGEVEQHSMPDQIAADRPLASKDAAGGRGLRVRVGSEPGARHGLRLR